MITKQFFFHCRSFSWPALHVQEPLSSSSKGKLFFCCCCWIALSSRSWWWTGRPGLLEFMGSKVLDMIEQLNWTEHGPAHQNKMQFPPQSVSAIQKLPSTSYSSPSEGRQTENHNHRKLTKLITRITALSNSLKLWAMPCRATQDRWVMVESSDKTWSIEEGNGKPLQYSFLENPMNGMKRQKDMILKDELPFNSS